MLRTLAEARLEGRHGHAALHHTAPLPQQPRIRLCDVAALGPTPERLGHPRRTGPDAHIHHRCVGVLSPKAGLCAKHLPQQSPP